MPESTLVATESLCEVRGVRHEFKLPNGLPLHVLEDVSLAIRPNEIVALLGPSGCGKSTLLRILAGLIPPTGGEVLYHGRPLQGLNPGTAVVFQSFALYPNLSVHDNIAFPLKIRKMTGSTIKKKVEEAATKLRITHLLPKRPYRLLAPR